MKSNFRYFLFFIILFILNITFLFAENKFSDVEDSLVFHFETAACKDEAAAEKAMAALEIQIQDFFTDGVIYTLSEDKVTLIEKTVAKAEYQNVRCRFWKKRSSFFLTKSGRVVISAKKPEGKIVSLKLHFAGGTTELAALIVRAAVKKAGVDVTTKGRVYTVQDFIVNLADNTVRGTFLVVPESSY